MILKVEQVKAEKKEIKVELGQIYKSLNSYYLVSKACNGHSGILYNLTNIETGNRWTDELNKQELQKEIFRTGLELVKVKELVIREEV